MLTSDKINYAKTFNTVLKPNEINSQIPMIILLQ